MIEYLKKSRALLNDRLTARGLAHTFSLASYLLEKATRPRIDRYARGTLLDAGSGRSPYKKELQARGVQVVSIDVEDRAGEIDHVTDIQDMPPIADSSMDVVLCTQVLEHVPRPWDAVREIERVLKPGGTLILSVPHLSLIHEAPHDYYRYTRYGLTSMIEAAGLEVAEIQATGGLVAFLMHLASMGLLCTIGAVPGLRWITWAINYAVLVRLMEPVDRVLGLSAIYPCDYVVVASKPT